jgi:hypothetical protein
MAKKRTAPIDVTKLPIPRVRKKPGPKPGQIHGGSFPKENKVGKDFWFKKGKSGNPGGQGRVSLKPFTESAKRIADTVMSDEECLMLRMPMGSTYGFAAVLGGFRASIKGSSNAFRNLRETFEGVLAQQFKLTGGDGEPLNAPSFVVNFTASTTNPEGIDAPTSPESNSKK